MLMILKTVGSQMGSLAAAEERGGARGGGRRGEKVCFKTATNSGKRCL